MPDTSNVISCKLNKDFVKVKKASKFKLAEVRRENDWGSYRVNMMTDGKNNFIYGKSGACCGISEIMFYDLLTDMKKQKVDLTDEEFADLISKWIEQQSRPYNPSRKDNRIVFCGLPTRVSRTSMYDVNFYKRLKDLLLSWGFVQLSKRPYKNANSGNSIVVLAGQMTS